MAMLIWAITADGHYYNNVRIKDNAPIYSIAQDENDLIWLGTENGLYLYDGYRCVPQQTADHELSHQIYCIKSNGPYLYLGTPKGFLIYDTHHNTLTKPQQKISEVRGIAIANHQIMIGAKEGLYHYTPKTGNIGMAENSIKNIFALLNSGDALYIGALTGAYKRQNGKNTPIVLREGSQPFVNTLYEDPQQPYIWIGAGDMLYQYNQRTNTITSHPTLTGSSVKSIAQTDNGTRYIATDNGLYTYQKNNWTLELHDARNPHTLADNVVWSATIDKWGNALFGTDGGLSIILHSSYYQYFAIHQLTQIGDGNKLTTLLVDSKGRKWLGGNNGVILKGETTRWFSQTSKSYPMPHNRIRQVYEDLSGNIWIATDNGVALFDEHTQQMRQIVVTDKTGQYSARWAYDIIDDGKGRLWIAAFSGGIFIIDKESLKKANGTIVPEQHICSKLSGQWVRQLIKDKSGHIWARTGKGIDCINILTLAVKHIEQGNGGYMMCDRQGHVWVAGNEQLACYEGDKRVKLLHLGHNQPTEAIGLYEINNQKWVITNKECVLIDEHEEGKRLRIPIIEGYGTCYSPQEKCLYIGGADGLITMHPIEVNGNQINRKLILSNLLVNGMPKPCNNHDISLAHNENSIELWLSDLPYCGEVSVSYAYQLSGLDDGWHLMNSVEEPLVYSSLPIGDYTLTIRTVDQAGSQDSEVFSINICILPPWYLSRWAKAVYFMLLFGLLFGLNRFYHVRKQLIREQREKQRMLEQSKVRMDFYTNLSRSLNDKLKHMRLPLKQLEQAGDSTAPHQATSAVSTEIAQMEQLIHQAFDFGLDSADKPIIPTTQETQDPAAPVSEKDEKLLREITAIIEKNLIDSDFNVTMLQESVGIGQKLLYRKIKQVTGMTPVEYIRHIRLEKAARLLKEGRFSVSEVMYMVGFTKSGYFSKCFQEAYGMTPSAYIKQR